MSQPRLRSAAIVATTLLLTFGAIIFVELAGLDVLSFIVLPAGIFLAGYAVRWDKQHNREPA